MTDTGASLGPALSDCDTGAYLGLCKLTVTLGTLQGLHRLTKISFTLYSQADLFNRTSFWLPWEVSATFQLMLKTCIGPHLVFLLLEPGEDVGLPAQVDIVVVHHAAARHCGWWRHLQVFHFKQHGHLVDSNGTIIVVVQVMCVTHHSHTHMHARMQAHTHLNCCTY